VEILVQSSAVFALT